jgi:hypothetical protein
VLTTMRTLWPATGGRGTVPPERCPAGEPSADGGRAAETYAPTEQIRRSKCRFTSRDELRRIGAARICRTDGAVFFVCGDAR